MNQPNNGPTKKNNISIANYLNNLNIVTTPYEKVLSIIKEAKAFIDKITNNKNKLINELDWAIKVITTHSLYTYELKEKDLLNKLSKENEEFKQYVQFVSEYNEKVIEMNKKINVVGVKKVDLNDELLEKSSLNLKRYKVVRKNSLPASPNNILDKYQEEKSSSPSPIKTKKDRIIPKTITSSKITSDKAIKHRSNKSQQQDIINSTLGSIKSKKEKINKKMIAINDERKPKDDAIDTYSLFQKFSFNSAKKPTNAIKEKKYIDKKIPETEKKQKNPKNIRGIYQPYIKIDININNSNNKIINENKQNTDNNNKSPTQKDFPKFPAIQNIQLNTNLYTSYLSDKGTQSKIKNKRFNSSKVVAQGINFLSSGARLHYKESYSFNELENILIHENFDYKSILEKNFNIFALKEIIGHNNVLPFMGRVILDSFGLIDEKIMAIDKLDLFLSTLNSQYLTKPLYHTSVHGADVTQSIALYFLNANAEKVCQTKVIDLLGILIAAMGHDLGHPGLTNSFQINAFTDMALVYNGISCLENYHASRLFFILRDEKTNIFENLTSPEFNLIRRRMISEILATDMANHVRVMIGVKSNIHEYIPNNSTNVVKEFKLSGNENTKFDEQQSLLNFFIHSADLAHNAKLFKISLQWVELLSEEFWNQGDLEKELNLPVTFLCDRDKIDIPSSQKAFINGFIKPTFECLADIFPTLKFFMNNANDNLVEWQKLFDQHRQKGWTPTNKKTKKQIRFGENNQIITNNKIKNKNNKYNKNDLEISWKITEKLISPIKEKGNPFNNDNDGSIRKVNSVHEQNKKSISPKKNKNCK